MKVKVEIEREERGRSDLHLQPSGGMAKEAKGVENVARSLDQNYYGFMVSFRPSMHVPPPCNDCVTQRGGGDRGADGRAVDRSNAEGKRGYILELKEQSVSEV